MNSKKKKFDFTSLLMVLILLVGLGILLYPSVSDYWNSLIQSRAITEYVSAMSEMDEEECERLLNQARQYNKDLSQIDYPLMYYDKVPGYEELLNVGGNGIMGYVTIPSIHVELPIYHGTEASVLQVAVGHVQGSSLPTGGIGTHTLLSAHRGLPSARLFSDLDKVKLGDRFTLSVLNQDLIYQVDKISVVEPQEVEALYAQEDADYCTLITCTPYGVNTHRLLVRGVRVEPPAEKPAVYVKPEAYKLSSMVVTPIVALPMMLALLIFLLIKYRKKK